jgi:hypothetical protein
MTRRILGIAVLTTEQRSVRTWWHQCRIDPATIFAHSRLYSLVAWKESEEGKLWCSSNRALSGTPLIPRLSLALAVARSQSFRAPVCGICK